MSEQRFTLQEELVLLSLDERSGRLRQTNLRYAMAAAALAELLIRRCLRHEMGRIDVRHADPIGDSAIDPALRRIANSARARKLTWWVRNLYPSVRQPVDAVAARLVERGAVTRCEHTALLVIHWADYPVLEPAYGQRLRRRIHTALKTDGPVEDQLATLIAILHHSGRMDTAVDRSEQREYERRIAAIVAGHEVAFTVGKAITEVLCEDSEAQDRVRRQVIIIGRPSRPSPPRRRRRSGDPTFPGEAPGPNRPWHQTESESSS
jgi:hypothetical protein